MLLKAIEALELPKSALLCTVAYAAPKFVPKKGMSFLEVRPWTYRLQYVP